MSFNLKTVKALVMSVTIGFSPLLKAQSSESMMKEMVTEISATDSTGSADDITESEDQRGSRDSGGSSNRRESRQESRSESRKEERKHERSQRQETRREEPKREERRTETRREEPKREERRTESHRAETRREEPKREERRTETRREEPKREERRAESHRAETRREEPKREETRRTETRREEPKREERRAESHRAETRREEAKREETRRSEARRTETRREDRGSLRNRDRAELPKRMTLDNKQGGIGGQYKHAELSNIKRKNKDTYEGVDNKGNKVRFKENADGTHRITSVNKKDPTTGARSTFNYDNSGRRVHAKIERRDGSVVEKRIHRDGTSRTVTTLRSGERIVSDSRRGGYIEKHVRNYRGQTVVQRTYVNRVYNRTYVRNYYYDRGYYSYSPSYRFYPSFYSGFLFGSAWTRPVYYPYYYGWSWYPNTWLFHPHNPYAYYFTPYATYSSPFYWITDYLIADTIASSYENRMRAENAEMREENRELRNRIGQLQGEISSMERSQPNQQVVQVQIESAGNQATLTPAMKEQIARQVEAELKAHQGNSSVPVSSVLHDLNYMFLANEEMDASFEDAQGVTQDCTLAEGDIFKLAQPVNEGDLVASIKVVTSKRSADNCKAGAVAVISVSDLQEAKNDMTARIEAGAKAAHDQQGQKGMPRVDAQGQKTSETVASGGDAKRYIEQMDKLDQSVDTEATALESAD